LTLTLLGGFLAPTIPKFLSWARYLSIIQYGFSASEIFEFSYGNRSFQCTSNSNSNSSMSSSSSSLIFSACQNQNNNNNNNNNTNDIWISGDDILNVLSKQQNGVGTIGLDIGMLVVIYIVCRTGAYIALRYNIGDEQGRN